MQDDMSNYSLVLNMSNIVSYMIRIRPLGLLFDSAYFCNLQIGSDQYRVTHMIL